MSIIKSLKGGDLRTIGAAEAVVRRVQHDTMLLDELFEALFEDDPVVRMRASDSLEKVVRDHRELLFPYKARLLKNVRHFDNHPEMKMHASLLLGYLDLSRAEAVRVSEKLFQWLRSDKNKFVQVNCMTGLCDIALKQPWIRQEVIATIVEFMIKGSAALKARGRILLKRLAEE